MSIAGSLECNPGGRAVPLLDKKGPHAGQGDGGDDQNQDDGKSAPRGPQEEIATFVACVFEPDDWVEIRRLPNGRCSGQRASELAGLAAALEQDNKAARNIYVGANPRKTRGGRKTEDVALARCLFVDLDNMTEQQALDRLRKSGLPIPTITLSSGHGVHAYWRLSEPLVNLDTWSSWQRDLITLLGSDPKVHDPPRIMRLPGFMNVKEPERPMRCRIIDANASRTFDLSDFHELVPHTDDHKQLEPDFTPTAVAESTNEAIKRATEFIAKFEGVREGFRNARAQQIAAALTHDFALSDEDAWPLLHSWNEQNEPPLDEAELRLCLKNGRKYGKKPIGCRLATPNAPATSNSNQVPWPEPLDEAAYHGIAGEVVRLIEPHTEADPVALLLQFLVVFGNVVHRHVHFVVDGARHGLNLFAVLVGETSKARKGTSWAHIRRLFERVAREWIAHRVLSGLSSGEGVIWNVRDPIYKKVKSRKTKALEERLVDEGVTDKRMLVLESEFATALRVIERDGNTLSAVIRRAWDEGNLRVMTKNSPAVATEAHVSIVGHITLDELRRYLSTTEVANGFGNRFLFVCARRSKCLPEGGGIVEFDGIDKQLLGLVESAKTQKELSKDPEAREFWATVYPDLSAGKPGLVGAMTSRAEAQAMRLAAVYATLDRSDRIRVPHLKAALAICTYCEQSVRHIFGDAFGDQVADTILGALRTRPNGMTRTEIGDLFGRHKNSTRISQALTLLAERGLALQSVEQTGGRPAERWLAIDPREKREKGG